MLPRLIPLILIENGRAVHTVRFGRGEYLGDPLNMARLFSGFGADELMILDRSQSSRANVLTSGGLARMSREVFAPISYGGGLRSQSDVALAFKSGADKVVFRSDRVESARLIPWACSEFGAQAVAVCINYGPIRSFFRGNSGSHPRKVVEQAVRFTEMGAGEVLVQNVSRVGTKVGLDTKAMTEVRESVTVPVVISGGASSPLDIDNAFREGFSGVAISTLFSLDHRSSSPLISYYSDEEKQEFNWLQPSSNGKS